VVTLRVIRDARTMKRVGLERKYQSWLCLFTNLVEQWAHAITIAKLRKLTALDQA
jgi:hypothetical protein